MWWFILFLLRRPQKLLFFVFYLIFLTHNHVPTTRIVHNILSCATAYTYSTNITDDPRRLSTFAAAFIHLPTCTSTISTSFYSWLIYSTIASLASRISLLTIGLQTAIAAATTAVSFRIWCSRSCAHFWRMNEWKLNAKILREDWNWNNGEKLFFPFLFFFFLFHKIFAEINVSTWNERKMVLALASAGVAV